MTGRDRIMGDFFPHFCNCYHYVNNIPHEKDNENDPKAKYPSTSTPCFTALCRNYILYKLKGGSNPASSKLIGTIFLIAFVHCVYLSHILAILVIFQYFSLLLLSVTVI